MAERREELLALAERCEAATGADRELDARIWCEVGNELGFDDPPQRHRLMRPLQPRICIMGRWLGSALDKYPNDIEGVAHNWRVPAFSASLDAAITLVPEGWAKTVADYWCEGEDRPPFFADCADLSALKRGEDMMVYTAFAATPALALTAASLRALAAQEITS